VHDKKLSFFSWRRLGIYLIFEDTPYLKQTSFWRMRYAVDFLFRICMYRKKTDKTLTHHHALTQIKIRTETENMINIYLVLKTQSLL